MTKRTTTLWSNLEPSNGFGAATAGGNSDKSSLMSPAKGASSTAAESPPWGGDFCEEALEAAKLVSNAVELCLDYQPAAAATLPLRRDGNDNDVRRGPSFCDTG